VNERDLAELLREHAGAHRVPGAAVGLLRQGVETFAFSGVADLRTGAPVTAESRFGVGSLTKSMVATTVCRFAKEGRLSFDDPIVTYVPELRGTGWAERATVRDLLGNRSGLPLRAQLEFDFTSEEDEGDDALSRFATRVAAEEPTTVAWSYTNAGWCVLGRAIETVAGSPWEESTRANLLLPAGMSQTTVAGPACEHRVAGHELTADGWVTVEPLVTRRLGPAGTSLVSTIGDVVRFAALHLDDPSLAELRRVHAEPRIHGWLDGWGLGWAWFDWGGDPVWGWDSVLNGERAVLRLIPEQHAAVVMMTNGGNGRALYRSLLGDLLDRCFGITMPPLRLTPSLGAAGDLSRFAGAYGWPDRRWEVTVRDACLVITRDDNVVDALPVDERTFLVDAADPDTPTVTFGELDDRGRPGVVYDMLWALPRCVNGGPPGKGM
jgi:CubicO group peptidase (beta-lactamase class C family)